MLGGSLLYFGLRRLFDLHAIARRAFGRQVFRVNSRVVLGIARQMTLVLTNGSLQRSLWWVLVTLFAVALMPGIGAALDAAGLLAWDCTGGPGAPVAIKLGWRGRPDAPDAPAVFLTLGAGAP